MSHCNTVPAAGLSICGQSTLLPILDAVGIDGFESEYPKELSGGMISEASDAKNFNLLLASTIALAAVVVTTNRLVWRRLYRLAETRFTLES